MRCTRVRRQRPGNAAAPHLCGLAAQGVLHGHQATLNMDYQMHYQETQRLMAIQRLGV